MDWKIFRIVIYFLKGEIMKKFSEKFRISQIAAVFAVAMLFVFSFFLNVKQNCSEKTTVRFENTSHQDIPASDEQHNFKSSIFRTAVPVVNSSKNEKSSNPPLNRICGALFSRTFISFAVIFRSKNPFAENSVFQKYLKSSIPVRAGPCHS